jgi:hypothetical protein
MLVLPKPRLYAFILGPMLLVDETVIPRRMGNRRGDGEPLSANQGNNGALKDADAAVGQASAPDRR